MGSRHARMRNKTPLRFVWPSLSATVTSKVYGPATMSRTSHCAILGSRSAATQRLSSSDSTVMSARTLRGVAVIVVGYGAGVCGRVAGCLVARRAPEPGRPVVDVGTLAFGDTALVLRIAAAPIAIIPTMRRFRCFGCRRSSGPIHGWQPSAPPFTGLVEGVFLLAPAKMPIAALATLRKRLTAPGPGRPRLVSSPTDRARGRRRRDTGKLLSPPASSSCARWHRSRSGYCCDGPVGRRSSDIVALQQLGDRSIELLAAAHFLEPPEEILRARPRPLVALKVVQDLARGAS